MKYMYKIQWSVIFLSQNGVRINDTFIKILLTSLHIFLLKTKYEKNTFQLIYLFICKKNDIFKLEIDIFKPKIGKSNN